MNISSIKVGMNVYHRSYGIVKVLRKVGTGVSTRVIIEKSIEDRHIATDFEDEDDDEEEEDNEVSVRAGDLIPKASMTPQMHERVKQKIAEKKEKEERELQWEVWKQQLPEIPTLVKDHLKNCCQDGMMSFLVFLNADPDALDKLKQHSMYLLREQVDRVTVQVAEMDQELKGKKEFLAMIQKSKIQTKGVKIAKTA